VACGKIGFLCGFRLHPQCLCRSFVDQMPASPLGVDRLPIEAAFANTAFFSLRPFLLSSSPLLPFAPRPPLQHRSAPLFHFSAGSLSSAPRRTHSSPCVFYFSLRQPLFCDRKADLHEHWPDVPLSYPICWFRGSRGLLLLSPDFPR